MSRCLVLYGEQVGLRRTDDDALELREADVPDDWRADVRILHARRVLGAPINAESVRSLLVDERRGAVALLLNVTDDEAAALENAPALAFACAPLATLLAGAAYRSGAAGGALRCIGAALFDATDADPAADPVADPAVDPVADTAVDPAVDPMADPAADPAAGAPALAVDAPAPPRPAAAARFLRALEQARVTTNVKMLLEPPSVVEMFARDVQPPLSPIDTIEILSFDGDDEAENLSLAALDSWTMRFVVVRFYAALDSKLGNALVELAARAKELVVSFPLGADVALICKLIELEGVSFVATGDEDDANDVAQKVGVEKLVLYRRIKLMKTPLSGHADSAAAVRLDIFQLLEYESQRIG